MVISEKRSTSGKLVSNMKKMVVKTFRMYMSFGKSLNFFPSDFSRVAPPGDCGSSHLDEIPGIYSHLFPQFSTCNPVRCWFEVKNMIYTIYIHT